MMWAHWLDPLVMALALAYLVMAVADPLSIWAHWFGHLAYITRKTWRTPRMLYLLVLILLVVAPWNRH